MGGLEPHGQGPEAALCGSVERLTALQEVLVEVEADIGLQALWETLQDLWVKHEAGTVTSCGRRYDYVFKSFGAQGFIMCVELWVWGEVAGQIFPEKFDTVATCVLSFFSKANVHCRGNSISTQYGMCTTKRQHYSILSQIMNIEKPSIL